MKVYQRLLLRRAFSSSLWTALGGALLFSLIDLSSHLWIFSSGNSWLIISFALAQLSKMLPQITGFAVLIGTLTAILHLHSRGEITALRAAGLSKRCLIWPLICSSLIFSLINLANYEWLYPTASQTLQVVKQKRGPGKNALQSISLGPNEHLIFQKQEAGLLYDAFIINKKQVLHCQTIDIMNQIGHFVDCFDRTPSLTHSGNEKSLYLTNLQYLNNRLIDARDPETLKISLLAKGSHHRRSFALAFQGKLILIALAPMAALLASATLSFRSRMQSRTRTYFFAVSMYLIYIMTLSSLLFLIGSLPQLPSSLLWLQPIPLLLMYKLLKTIENKYSN